MAQNSLVFADMPLSNYWV